MSNFCGYPEHRRAAASRLPADRPFGSGGLNPTRTLTYNATNDQLTSTDPIGHTTRSVVVPERPGVLRAAWGDAPRRTSIHMG